MKCFEMSNNDMKEGSRDDFAARMDWSVTGKFDGANHNPVAVLNGEASKDILYMNVRRGDTVKLLAAGSSDPDADELSYEWMHYREPGTYGGAVKIEGADKCEIRFEAPRVYGPETIHIVLTVKDNGSPSLYAYRRAMIIVNYH